MERLTEHEERYYGETFKTRQMCYMGFDGDCKYDTCCGCTILAMYRKLAHLEDLQEQGRLVELPCKVGDMVYRINRIFGQKSISEESFSISNLSQFGSRLFLTCEAAEAQSALDRTEGQK